MPIPHERNTIGDKPDSLIQGRAWSGFRTRWQRVSAVFRNRSCERRRPLYYTITVYFRVKDRFLRFSRSITLTRYPPFKTIKTDPLSMSVAPTNRTPMFCSLKTTAPYKTPKRTLRRLRDIM
jgi:hypothetical protein